jgi:xanthine/CO dehydrogenase XdhC/CoxF family maturation factor
MKELQDIVHAYDSAKKAGQACVLATVVHLEGSSYRGPGARMLVLENGLMIGAISGGCLEGDALKKALLTFTEKKSRLITYDTSHEEEASVGIQLGCEGVIQVLFEFIQINDPLNPIELLRKAIAIRQEAVLITLFNLKDKREIQIGTCLLAEPDGTITSSILDNDLKSAIHPTLTEIFTQKKSSFKDFTLQGVLTNVFIEFIAPPISLVIVGAGNDAIPMMQIASILGWEVKIVDGRNTHAKADRFISACQILVSKPAAVLEQIKIDSKTCFVLMTHNYNYDLQMMHALIETEINYIGLLGPKKKLEKILTDLKLKAVDITDEKLAKIYGPTGLDIGAASPEEIATSIIAEIQAVFNHKKGTMLKWKKDQIHSA